MSLTRLLRVNFFLISSGSTEQSAIGDAEMAKYKPAEKEGRTDSINYTTGLECLTRNKE